MKIAFIASRNISEIGGIENYMANLCPKLVEQGHEVILYTEGAKSESYYYKSVEIITFKSVKNRFFNKILLGLKATFNAVFSQKNIEIFHYNAMAAGLSSFIPNVFGKHVIFQMHGIEWQRRKWSVSSRVIIKLLESFVIKLNKNIIAVSQEQSDYVKNKFNKNCVTIFPGTNIPEQEIVSKTILEDYNLLKNKYILFIGRLVEEKRPDLLINAYNNLEDTDIKLVIAGDNDYFDKYIAKLKQLALNNKNIVFTGSVFNNDKNVLLSNCLLFCSPSELEGLPITLLEAMSYKKICVVSNINAHKEAIAENGIYFKKNNIEDLQNKLEYSINNNELGRLGELNYLRVKQNFTWDIISGKYEQYCMELLAK